MDVVSLMGLMLGLGVIVVANFLEGGEFALLVNGPAFMIVIGGTVAAVLIQTPFPVIRRSLAIFTWVFKPPKLALSPALGKLLEWSEVCRREGLVGLEPFVHSEQDIFLKKGLNLVSQGFEPEEIRKVLETEVGAIEHRGLQAAKVFEAMGGYAPTLGIIGAVLGLTQVVTHLDSPQQLGEGVASAFIATIYGVAASNLVFLPIAQKLKTRVCDLILIYESMVEGFIDIANGQSTDAIEVKLCGLKRKPGAAIRTH